MNEFMDLDTKVSAFYFCVFAIAQIVTNIIHWTRIRRLEDDLDRYKATLDNIADVILADHPGAQHERPH